MEYQPPAEGITKIYEYGKCMSYNVKCSCQNPDDEIYFEIEAEDSDISLNTTIKAKTPYWKSLLKDCKYPMFNSSWLNSIDWSVRSFINGFYHRIMVTYEVWSKGYVTYYSTTIMDKQVAFNYAHTILKGIEYLENIKDE